MRYIIIPACETNEFCKTYLDNLLISIKAGGYYENDYHVVLCYDNCSKAFQKHFVERFKGDKIVALENINPKNLNFVKNVNSGLRWALAQGGLEHAIILNMDTVLPPASRFGAVLGEGLSFPEQVDNKELMGPDVVHNCAMPKRTSVLRAGGFCMCLSKALLDKVGVLDERFTASFEDDDSSVRAALAGFPVEVVGVQVHHEMKHRTAEVITSTGAYTHSSLGLHMAIFRRKWQIPPEILHDGFNAWILDNHEWSDEMRCS